MSKITQFVGKPKTFKIGEVELVIKPFTVNDINLFVDMQDSDKRADALKQMIRLTLKQSIPDATDEEIDSFGLQYFKEVIDAILQVNNMEKYANEAANTLLPAKK